MILLESVISAICYIDMVTTSGHNLGYASQVIRLVKCQGLGSWIMGQILATKLRLSWQTNEFD